MGSVRNEILTSVKLRHLTPTSRWVWVILNLLDTNMDQRVCSPQGQIYSISELTAFSMIDDQTIRECISELVNMAMVELDDNSLRLCWDSNEEKRHRKRLNARNRKARQRSRDKQRRVENGN